jgi:hypothetical protein
MRFWSNLPRFTQYRNVMSLNSPNVFFWARMEILMVLKHPLLKIRLKMKASYRNILSLALIVAKFY